jgi:hypothetical protein
MKRTIIAVLAAAIYALSQPLAMAEGQNVVTNQSLNPWTPSVTFSSVLASKYVSSVSGGTCYDKPMVQSDLFISFQNGFYVDLWNSTPFQGYNHNYGTEQDFGIGWSGALSTFGLKGPVSDLVLDVNFEYFDEPVLLTFGAGDILYGKINLSKAFKWVTINACYEDCVNMPGTGCKGGSFYSVGASKGVSFFKDRVNASTAFMFTYDDGGYGLDKGFFLHGSAELDWKLTKHLTLFLPRVKYALPLTVHDDRSPNIGFLGGFSYRF